MTKTATKSADAADTKTLIVLGYDEDQKPRAARFPAADANLVAKAAQLMDLKIYEATTEELAALAKKLPLGRKSLWSSRPSLRPPSAKTTTTCQWRLACPGPGTRSRLAISSSPRKLWNTAGGKQLSSPATVTCSRCGFGTTRSCPSSHAIVRQSR